MVNIYNSAARGLGVALLATLTTAAHAQPQSSGDSPVVDHHMHIFSPESARVLKISCARVGPVKCPPEISTSPSTGHDAVEALNGDGIRRGVLLSTGYFYGSPELADLKLDVAAETRAENAFVVGEAKAQCGRLVAFISVDPLAPNALEEIAYWGKAGGASGLKLHLSNSSFDFRSPPQVKRLAAIFRLAAHQHFPIIIHLETRASDYGERDVRIFLTEVAPFARTMPIQVAHTAGGGGIDANSLSALGAFADAFDHDPLGTKNIFFDLAMVPDEMSNDAKLKATEANVVKLKALIEKIGVRRFVLGSDWTYPLNLKRYYEDEKAALNLSDQEWRSLASNVAPYVSAGTRAVAACTLGRSAVD